MQTSLKKNRQSSKSNRRNQTRKPGSKREHESVSDLEDINAKDAGSTTPCGQPAAMDSAPAPKATSPMKLRNSSNRNFGPEAKKTRSNRGY